MQTKLKKLFKVVNNDIRYDIEKYFITNQEKLGLQFFQFSL